VSYPISQILSCYSSCLSHDRECFYSRKRRVLIMKKYFSK